MYCVCLVQRGPEGREHCPESAPEMAGAPAEPWQLLLRGSGLDHQRAEEQPEVHRVGPGGLG